MSIGKCKKEIKKENSKIFTSKQAQCWCSQKDTDKIEKEDHIAKNKKIGFGAEEGSR